MNSEIGGSQTLYVPPIVELDRIPKPLSVNGDNWGFCGIAAMSAAIAAPPLTIHAAIPEWPGYTPSSMIIRTLKSFGYGCRRLIVKTSQQRDWPEFDVEKFPSKVALGRIYWGEGKYAGSHWIVFRWDDSLPVLVYTAFESPPPCETPFYNNKLPAFYDSAHRLEYWFDTNFFKFWDDPARLKSLYFVKKKDG